jgi:hypothetical protein
MTRDEQPITNYQNQLPITNQTLQALFVLGNAISGPIVIGFAFRFLKRNRGLQLAGPESD